MADHSRAKENAMKITRWLADNREEFEQDGINDDKLASALNLSEEDLADALDYMENREEVVRFPHAMSSPPVVTLKPGRGWPDIRDEMLARKPGPAE